jgi:hypothetical protein
MSPTKEVEVESPIAGQLLFLAGSLSGPEEAYASSWTEASSAVGSVHGQFELAGTVVVQHQTHERDGTGSFQALNVFMVDPATEEILLYCFDTVGFPPDPPARGTWHGEDLVLDRSTARGSSRTTYTPTSAGYRWSKRFRAPSDQDWAPVVDGHMTRDE